MELIKLNERNYMFTQNIEQWGGLPLNLGLIKAEYRNYLIDTGLGSNNSIEIIEYLKDSEKPLVVINSHAHWDHVWGNFDFKECLIVAHEECRKLLEDDWDSDFETVTTKFEGIADGEVKKCLPNVTFKHELTFEDDQILLFHTPGHTSNCISVYDKVTKVLYVGDAIGDQGITNLQYIPYINTNKETMRETIQLWKQMDIDQIVVGHNQILSHDVIGIMETVLDDAWEDQLKNATTEE